MHDKGSNFYICASLSEGNIQASITQTALKNLWIPNRSVIAWSDDVKWKETGSAEGLDLVPFLSFT